METKSDESNGGWDDDGMDPRSQLSMLEKVQNATEVEAWLPPTPVWHAPLLAAVIAGAALVSDGPSRGWTYVGLIVGGICFLIGFVDQIRRQRVRPRRLRQPARVFWFYMFIAVVIFVLLGLWGSVTWPSSLSAQVVTVGGLWLGTAAVFALGITITNRMRDRWAASPR